jgi:hypothetical protein
VKFKLKNILKKTPIWNLYQLCNLKRMIKKDGIKYDNRQLFLEHNLNILFIHIPKAAGMSVVNSLYNMNKSHHATALDYCNENKERFDSTFSFAITREPYARLYSAYYYLKSGGMNLIDKAWWDLYLRKYNNFEDFITQGGLEYAIEKNAEHFIPQYKFIYDEQNELLCDYVGKVENIQDIEHVISKKQQKPIQFMKKNVVNKTTLSIDDLYTNEMITIVNQCYEKDFALLDYETK